MSETPLNREALRDAKFAEDSQVRLQKALAAAGVASRRASEEIIRAGRVKINGKVVYELGVKINPESDLIQVDGVTVQLDVTKRYYVLNKPRGVVSSMRDEQGRPDLREFTDLLDERVYNVGRLDTDTSGLLVLTNDGELAHQLAHPSFGVEKTYIAQVKGKIMPQALQRLKDGIELEDGFIRADRIKKITAGSNAHSSLVEIVLHSGRNRIVRRMFAAVGHPVQELVRRQFGPLHLGSLGVGHLRELTEAERAALLTSVSGDKGAKKVRTGRVTAGRPGDGAGARGLRGVAKPKSGARGVKPVRRRET